MSESLLFNTYLTTRMAEVGVDELVLARELDYRTLVPVSLWCKGQTLPRAHVLPGIAAVLQADPVVVGTIWLASKCPELEGVLRAEVLEPRGVSLPRQL